MDLKRKIKPLLLTNLNSIHTKFGLKLILLRIFLWNSYYLLNTKKIYQAGGASNAQDSSFELYIW